MSFCENDNEMIELDEPSCSEIMELDEDFYCKSNKMDIVKDQVEEIVDFVPEVFENRYFF